MGNWAVTIGKYERCCGPETNALRREAGPAGISALTYRARKQAAQSFSRCDSHLCAITVGRGCRDPHRLPKAGV